MADENLARADDAKTNEADGADAQAHTTDAVHSNDTKGNDDFATRVANAKTPEELAQLTNEFLTHGEKPASTEAEGDAPADTESGQDTGEEAGGEKGEEGADTGKVEDKEDSTETEGEGEPDHEDKGGKKLRLRMRVDPEKDAVGARALELKNRNPDLSVEECVQRARQQLGLDKTKTEDAKADGAKPEDKPGNAEPATVEEVETRLKDLKAARRKAMTEDLDFAKAADLDEQIDALKDKRTELVALKATSAQRAISEYDAKFDAAQSKATALYEFVGQADSTEAKRMLEIDAQLKESGDPLFNDPEKPLILAQMVAREFRVAPKTPGKSSTKPATEAKAAPAQTKKVAPIASGNSRTASNASNTAGQQILERASRIKTPAEMEDFLAGLR